jgi:hypothetical protein
LRSSVISYSIELALKVLGFSFKSGAMMLTFFEVTPGIPALSSISMKSKQDVLLVK